jgi:hypothetical protein
MPKSPIETRALEIAQTRIAIMFCALIGIFILIGGFGGLIIIAEGKFPFSFWIVARVLGAIVLGFLLILPAALSVIFRRRNLN